MPREPFNPALIRVPEKLVTKASIDRPLTVSQLNALVKDAIETALPATVHVIGEISNYKQHSSGHVYFTLKDRSSELACVIWRSSAASVKFTPTDGLEVIATGTITVFERGGRYQLIARKLEPRGVGALELALRQLSEKLAKEGLFDRARKRPLPRFPERIAVVTSPTGAAIADILRTIQRRYPCVDILIYPVRVQGAGAAEEIAAAVRKLNANREALGGIDVVIVGRGGGSLEDLWAFNEEIVARAIFASEIPVISAVGHEVDVTIADLVADVRAATPTAAAEMAVPVRDEVLVGVDSTGERLARSAANRRALGLSQLHAVANRRAFREPLLPIRAREQLVDEWTNRAHRTLTARVHATRLAVERAADLLPRIAPHAYLLRTAQRLHHLKQRLDRGIDHRRRRGEHRLGDLLRSIERAHPSHALVRARERLNAITHRLPLAIRHRLAQGINAVELNENLLAALSFKRVLARGFTLTRRKRDGAIVRSLKDVGDRQRIITQTQDGQFESEVLNQFQRELFDEPT